MINKLYKKNKKILVEDKIFLIVLLFAIICFIPLPYYIEAPGGIENMNKKIIIENEYKSVGTFNSVYISEYKANPFILLYAYLNPNYDIYKKEDYLAPNDTDKTMNYRGDIDMEQSLDYAVILAYSKAGEKVNITKSDVYVTYIYKEFAETDLEVGDRINLINNQRVKSLEEIHNVLNECVVGDKITIEVTNNDKIYNRYAIVKEINSKNVIGLVIGEDLEYEVDKKIKFKFKSNESGPSAGLITALEIYNELVQEDITHGHKIAGTGTIDREGNVGSIGGIKYKLKAAVKNKAEIFLVPKGENYDEALKFKEEFNYNIEIVEIDTFDTAINYLNDL